MFFKQSEYDNPYRMIKDYNNLYDNDGVIESLAHTEAYEDKREYNGRTIRFDKRLQLAIAMIYDRIYYHENMDWGNFNDIDKMTIFADYGIPAYLDSANLIKYNDELEQRIKNQEVIPENSTEEVEIRIATVKMGEYIQDYIYENKNKFLSVPQLDYALWKLRKEAQTNEHLTPTDSY